MPEVPIDQSVFIIWSSADPEVAHNIALMYGHNALSRGWWKRVRLIVWGPSARLVTEDDSIREKLQIMMQDGVEIWACRACADNYGVADQLESIGLDVRFVGQPVTEMLQQGWKQLAI